MLIFQVMIDFSKKWKPIIETNLEHWLSPTIHCPEKLYTAMRYSALAGGKRMRPLLVYATGLSLGASVADLAGLACAIEFVHVYSLIHDDLPAMDDDDLRRGKPTCHIAFDEATAILAGDALQTLAFEVLATCPLSPKVEPFRVRMIAALARSSGTAGMGGGQALDLEATGKTLSVEALSLLHSMKTGALIRTAVLLGALGAGKADPQELQILDNFGDKIGLAFQIHDDVLDIEGSTELLGKPQGSDVEAKKSTYPALMGLDQAKRKSQQLIEESLQALSQLPYNTEILASFARLVIERNH